MSTDQTPDEWLLERFEHDKNIRYGRASVGHVRPMFEILDDHLEPACVPSPSSPESIECRRWSGAAQWPRPRAHANIAALNSVDSADYARVNANARADLDERQPAA